MTNQISLFDAIDRFPVGTDVIFINSNNLARRGVVASPPYICDDVCDEGRIRIPISYTAGPAGTRFSIQPFVGRVGRLDGFQG